jgi:hypothetical protein
MTRTAAIALCFVVSVTVADTVRADTTPRSVHFSGYDWLVRRSAGPEGPGPNRFLDNRRTVWLDDEGQLHLKVWRRFDTAYAAEVISSRPLGHGVYIVETIARLDVMEPPVIFGMFTYDDDANFDHREIDIEYGRFGDPDAPNGQFVVQPFTRVGHVHQFSFAQDGDYLTHAFYWDESSIRFAAFHGHVAELIVREGMSSVPDNLRVAEWEFSGAVPPTGDERFRMNLWLYQSELPDSDHEVVISSFAFIPAPGSQ